MASTIKVTDIAYPGSANTALTINANDSVGIVGGNVSPYTGMRNRIINGGMTIDQRNNGAAVTTSGAFATDRFIGLGFSGYTTLTVSSQQSSDAPPNFTYSLKATVGTGQAVATSGSLITADHRIEGFNIADFGFGTANAQSFTLSFWVKSSITGTYPVSFFNSGVSRGYLATYTISAANTWEKKTITVSGDTSGTWNTTNGIGLGMQFSISAGSGENGTPGSWSGTYKRGVSGMPDVGATSGATWAITGVQLEKGSVATPFEFRSIGQEEILCYRYFQTYSNPPLRGVIASTFSAARCAMILPVVMRAQPTAVVGALTMFDGANITTVSSVGNAYLNSKAIEFDFTLTGGLSPFHPAIVYMSGTTNNLSVSAEL